MRPYVLITGASSGIGKAIAIKLSQNYNIILHGRNQSRLQQVRELCFEGDHIIWEKELGEVDNIEDNLASFIKANNIMIEYYVHSAGIMKMLPLKAQKIESIQEVFNINVYSAMLITKTLSSKKLNGGMLKSIVFISSNISQRGAKAFQVYAASKGALDSFMRSMAIELAPKIRVNSILPGAIYTDMTHHIFEDINFTTKMATNYPLGLGNPDNIADGVVFLLSDQAKWITGQQLVIDGGRTTDISE